MHIVELAFSDAAERLEARPAHRERLQRLHADAVLRIAGPFADDSGALLIFDVDDADELASIMDEDPYYRTPGVEVVRVQPYNPIIGPA